MNSLIIVELIALIKYFKTLNFTFYISMIYFPLAQYVTVILLVGYNCILFIDEIWLTC